MLKLLYLAELVAEPISALASFTNLLCDTGYWYAPMLLAY